MNEDTSEFGRYSIFDNQTSEILPIDPFVEHIAPGYWEKAYAKTIAEYIGIAGNSSAVVLGWIIQNKDTNNLVHGSFAEIAMACEVTKHPVSGVFQKLYKKQLIKKIRNGCYLVSPNVLRHGGKTRGIMILRLWNDS